MGSVNIRTKRWILEEDIAAASSTAMIAIPGASIVAVLADSIKKDKKKKTLIFWNEENFCTDSTRDIRDNVANVFWPKLMGVKAEMMEFKDMDESTMWIIASLCDGEDEKTQELERALGNLNMTEKENKKCLKVRAGVENIVHSLLRVQALSSRLSEIFVL